LGYYEIRRKINWFKLFIISVVATPILVLIGYVIDNLVGNFILQRGGPLPAQATSVINYVLSFSALTMGLLAFVGIIGVAIALVLAGVFGGGDGQSEY
jgi:hypothetical protein